MTDTADPLFRPLQLRSLTLANRIVMAPMTRAFSPEGVPGKDVAAYYARRAAGGVGLIITEGVGIDIPAAVDGTRIPVMYGADALAGWKRVVDAVHAEGGRIMPQLWHQGVFFDPEISRDPTTVPQSPSGYWGTPGNTSTAPEQIAKLSIPRAPMTEAEIAAVVSAFARAARAAVDVGFDGIAIHGAHGYLIDSFLWADTNRRTDRYSGSAVKRATFAAEVVAAIRAEIGEAIPIMFRFSQHKQQDYDAGFAASPEELGIVLNRIAEAGVDIFDASSRRFSRPAFQGSSITLAGWARKLTGKPTMTVGGIGLDNWMQETLRLGQETRAIDNLPEVRALMAEGMFDLVGVGRALISDPAWAQKARAGKPFLPFDKSTLARLE